MNTFEFRFPGRIPSKKNSKIMVCYGKRPVLLPSKAHKEWVARNQYELRVARDDQGITTPIGRDQVKYVRLTFVAPDRFRADLTNKAESIMDILVDYDILEDDNWFVVPELILSFKGVEKGKGGCTVEIVYKNAENAEMSLSEGS